MDKQTLDTARSAASTTGKTWGFICLGLIVIMIALAVLFTPWLLITIPIVLVGILTIAKLTKS